MTVQSQLKNKIKKAAVTRRRASTVVLDHPDSGLANEDTFQPLESQQHAVEIANCETRSMYECNECGAKFRRLAALKVHMSTHLSKEETEVKKEEKPTVKRRRASTAVPSSIRKHRKRTYDPKIFSCDKCGKEFHRLESIRAHMLSHLSKEEREMLRIHKCDVCGQKFTSQSYLRQHLIRVHIDNSFVCDICAKTYKEKRSLLHHHKTTHSASVPKVQCMVCKRLLMSARYLKVHMENLHSNNNGPHICDICQKELISSESLKKHKKDKHEIVRNYSCTFCHKAFITEVKLKEHMKMHLERGFFKCKFCKKTFKTYKRMHAHKKRMHPEEFDRLQRAKYGR